MESIIYYFVIGGLLVNIAHGIFLVSKGVIGQIQRPGNENASIPALSNGALLLSGTVNVLLGVTLFRLLRADLFSSILIIASLSAFSVWEWWVRSRSFRT